MTHPETMHLCQMLMNTPVTHMHGAWAEPEDRHWAGLGTFRYWQDIARTLERGCFDGVFFADTPAASGGYRGGQETALQYGVNWPTFDPMPAVAAILGATEHLGCIPTLTTSGTHPYLAVRRLSTLDYMSGGRMGWNVVTGHNKAEHAALGEPMKAHDDRYDLGDEYLEICYRYWQSVPSDVLVLDEEKRIFADPLRVDHVDYQGRFYSSSGYSPVLPSPQGRPVIFQAGSSPRGLQFAGQHAEAVFSVQPSLAGMARAVGRIRDAAEAAGRPEHARPLFAVQPVLGPTEEAARRREREYRDSVPLEAGLARLSGSLGIDFSVYDVDELFTELETDGSRGMMEAFAAPIDGRPPTLRDVALNFGMSVGAKKLVGSPEQVADELETLWRESGAHGFVLSPTISPGSVEEFVDQVVPILQQRGVYRREYTHTTLRANLTEK
jgi:FMN-dependent oxidoreductase (nitrilotriacetate monooxygenase family)